MFTVAPSRVINCQRPCACPLIQNRSQQRKFSRISKYPMYRNNKRLNNAMAGNKLLPYVPYIQYYQYKLLLRYMCYLKGQSTTDFMGRGDEFTAQVPNRTSSKVNLTLTFFGAMPFPTKDVYTFNKTFIF